ncbi:MAG: hypothetical protein HYV26_15180 [Candidatus Hydrogenedentes bacterium]|nr:hypothetical protein [Candidatus Hydrogenedentota bacterium]MBI3117549.1 hypothetical protein [Candidatus Hydrogenedentota bacterium]
MSAGSLIEQVVALEAEADHVLKDAQAEGRRIEQEGHEQIAAQRAETASRLAGRLREYRESAEARQAEALQKSEAALRRQLDVLDRLDDRCIDQYAGQVLASLVHG